MRSMLILAALAMAAAAQGVPAAGHTQAVGKDGRCRGPDGKFATAAACKGAGPAPAVDSLYRLDANGKCRDAKGRMAKAEKCGTVDNAPARAASAAAKKAP